MVDHPSRIQPQRKSAEPSADGGLTELPVGEIRSNEAYDERFVSGGSLAGLSLVEVEFDDCRFVATALSNADWRGPRLFGVRFENCDLANARWTDAKCERVALEKCRGTGLQLLDAQFSNVEFKGCKLHLSAFHGTRFRDCRWEDCDLREANFESVELNVAVFRNCDLRGARFPNARSTNLDLRGSHLTGVQCETRLLQGARVELSQLVDLAGLFGVIVEPIDEEQPRG